jgi:hypothetical protein
MKKSSFVIMLIILLLLGITITGCSMVSTQSGNKGASVVKIIPSSQNSQLQKEHKILISENKTIAKKEQLVIAENNSVQNTTTIEHNTTNSTEKSTANTTAKNTSTHTKTQNNTNTTSTDCLTKYNLTNETLIFYYSQSDMYSEDMQLIVSELSENYTFYKTGQLWDDEFNACFSIEAGHTPTFVCAGTQERIVGEVSRDELKAFADKCKS